MKQNNTSTYYAVFTTANKRLYIEDTYENAEKKKKVLENQVSGNIKIEKVELPIIIGYMKAIRLCKVTGWGFLIVALLCGLFKYYMYGIMFLIPVVVFSLMAISIIKRNRRMIELMAYKQLDDEGKI